ncbi:MAG: hypothetical protein ACH346_08565 [Chthoniobacterales bacterium]
MKTSSLFFAVIAFSFLSGCATGPAVDPQVTAVVSAHHVDQGTYDKISHGQSLDYNDLTNLVKSKVPSSIIVGYLRSTEKVYHFSNQQLRHLRSLGAKREVINYLNETEGFYGPPRSASHGLKVPKYVRDNTMLNQDKQPFFYNEPIIDDWYDSAYEESCYSPFSFN